MPITDLTGTIWAFNPTISCFTAGHTFSGEPTNWSNTLGFNVDFRYSLADGEYTATKIVTGYYGSYNLGIYRTDSSGGTGWRVAYSGSSKSSLTPSSAYTDWTIKIVGGEDVTNADLIAWLEANAVQVKTSVTFDLSTLDLPDGTHSITVKARGTGYISSPASEAVEYGGVKIVSWADGTDEQIAAMVAALDDGTISIEDTGWAVGDERKVTLSAMDATGVGESHVEQEVTLVLMDSQHYFLTEATAGGDTKDHFVVGLKNSLNENGYMNSTNTNSGSWSGCARRAWCNDVFRAAIPETLRGCFKQFKVPTTTTYNGSSVTETDDFFALFAEKEIFGSRNYSNTTEANALSQIKWYETAANRIKKAGDTGYAYYWWERSPRSDNSSTFCVVYTEGAQNYGAASNSYGFAPFGCI